MKLFAPPAAGSTGTDDSAPTRPAFEAMISTSSLLLPSFSRSITGGWGRLDGGVIPDGLPRVLLSGALYSVKEVDGFDDFFDSPFLDDDDDDEGVGDGGGEGGGDDSDGCGDVGLQSAVPDEGAKGVVEAFDMAAPVGCPADEESPGPESFSGGPVPPFSGSLILR